MLKPIENSREYILCKNSSIKRTFENFLTEESVKRMNESINKFNEINEEKHFKSSLNAKKIKCLGMIKLNSRG